MWWRREIRVACCELACRRSFFETSVLGRWRGFEILGRWSAARSLGEGFAEAGDDLGEEPASPFLGEACGQVFDLADERFRGGPEERFRFHVTARERVGHELEALQLEAGALRERLDLFGMEQENMPVGIRLELPRLVNRGVGAIGKFREVIPKIGTVRRGHDDVTARPDEGSDAREELIGMRGVFDDFGDERGVEKLRQLDLERITRRVGNGAALVFHPHVIGELGAPVVPRHLVAHLREGEGKIPLRRRDIEHAGAGGEHFGEEPDGFVAAFFVGVGVAEMRARPVDFLEIVEVGRLPGGRPIFVERDLFHDGKRVRKPAAGPALATGGRAAAEIAPRKPPGRRTELRKFARILASISGLVGKRNLCPVRND